MESTTLPVVLEGEVREKRAWVMSPALCRVRRTHILNENLCYKLAARKLKAIGFSRQVGSNTTIE